MSFTTTRRALLRLSLAAGAASLTLLAACGSSGDETPAPGTSRPDETPSTTTRFTLALSTPRVLVQQGQSVTLTATVTRATGFDGAVEVALNGLPAGVTASPVTIAAAATSAPVTLTAQAAAPHSLPTASTAVGTSGSETAQQPLTVTVRGPAGSLDTSFATAGIANTAIGTGEDYAEAMVVQPDGRIVVVGSTATLQGTDITLVRYQRDGALDTTFGNGGKVVTPVGAGSDEAYAVTLQADGKILVAGGSVQATSGIDFALLRYNADGSLDTSFGNGGKVVTAFGNATDRAQAIALQSDGKIVVGGSTSQTLSGTDFALARYNADGSLDTTFGNGGKVITALRSGTAGDAIYALALQRIANVEHIVAVGGDGNFLAARYTPAGTLDPSFGTGGIVTALFNSVGGAARGVVVTPDNKLVLAGQIDNDHALVRLSENGVLDGGFGVGGRVITAVTSTNWDGAQGVVRQADGKLVTGGWLNPNPGSSSDFAVLRYSADGVLDASFGNGGIVTTPVAPTTKTDSARAIALQADERVPTVRILLAGSANDANNNFAVTRYWP
ncbi:MAG TPA: hypothetical protein VFL64_05405 [Rhizobacter sp.]|nr:hypothetical protein [Rhizobacter sp.]